MKYLSLFSGIGGFEYGLQQSKTDFESVGFSEVNPYAKAIYTRWYPQHKDLGDATEIDPWEIDDFDLLVGGFPCQSFSIAGKREGFNECRGTLFFEIARICEARRLRYFLLENVKGLISHDRGRTFKTILRILSELGYDVEWEVINSKSFVPQNRERLYIKGYLRRECGGEILSQRRNRSETDIRLKPFKFNRQVKKRVHSVDYDELSAFLKRSKKDAHITLREISEKLDKPMTEVEHWFRTDNYFAPPTEDIWFPLKDMLNIKTDKYDAFMTEFVLEDSVYDMDRRAYDETGLARTLTTRDESLVKINVVGNISATNHKGDDIHSTDGLTPTLNANNYKHPLRIVEGDKCDFRIRKLTPLECERLQAFPDNYTKYGADGELISDTQRYKCLGNAVTTSVVTYIADTMFRTDENEDS